MKRISLEKTLWLTGWATIISYIVAVLANNALRLQNMRDLGMSEKMFSEVSFVYLIAGVLESPFHIPTALLCLFASVYLTKHPKTLLEIFE